MQKLSKYPENIPTDTSKVHFPVKIETGFIWISDPWYIYQNLTDYGLTHPGLDWDDWTEMIENMQKEKHEGIIQLETSEDGIANVAIIE